jgi:hypothetical protein
MTRQKGGWRHMHPDAVIVARPGRWGNPFDYRKAAEVGYGDGRSAAVDAFRGWLRGEDWGTPDGETRDSMEARRAEILSKLDQLRGRDLACWCPIEAPCHADVLMKLANR